MNNTEYTYYYFLGIGGIGMSALARYFNLQGAEVLGYDRTPSDLTSKLESEGIQIHYNDEVSCIPQRIIQNSEKTLIIYTPAIPADNKEFNFFKEHNFTYVKRAQVLGLICNEHNGIAISGTHGKTSITTFTSHIFYNSTKGCNAFLGGISKNFNTNYVIHPTSEYVVVEADEYDRSFHNLYPSTAIITSIDADHLDIYGSHEQIFESFYTFAKQIKNGGTLIYKKTVNIEPIVAELQNKKIKIYTYSLSDSNADFYASSIERKNNIYEITLQTPFGEITDILFSLPGKINIENMIAASSIAICNGITPQELKRAIVTLQGVERRLDIQVNNSKVVYLDDYAHHPEELKACISSIKELYFDKKITGIFQPHLYSRTKDFAKEFGESLSLLDELILLDIYPARELPIEGVSSDLIFNNVQISNKQICKKENLLHTIDSKMPEVLITMGAGDIDRFVKPITELLKRKTE